MSETNTASEKSTAGRMPVVFSGHGNPMLALQHNEITEGLRTLGDRIIAEHGKPRAILAISAHWYTYGSFVQTTATPRQVYDMYGFPEELYQVKYPVRGCPDLSARVRELLGMRVKPDDRWGIDHGIWTLLVHMFPMADVPVVQLSVDANLPAKALLALGRALSPLRDEGYLIFASGNVVHNLEEADWDNPESASDATIEFNDRVKNLVRANDVQAIMDYNALPHAAYAVPTPEHYLPLIYAMGAADGDSSEVFNDVCNLDSMAMTGFVFG